MTVDIAPLEFESTKDLNCLPKIVLGAGVFNYQYHDDPYALPVEHVIKRAFDLGIRAIDTSAYYGPSEAIVGEALKKLSNEYPRESYFICTKAGRQGSDQFNYKSHEIRSSVERSLKRLNTSYIDVLYIHDVEFVETEGCLEAISEAFELKKEGKVRYVGITAYPVEFLLYLAKRAANEIEPLDIILSYSNFCIQNTKLELFANRLIEEAGVTKVLNASPLSMSLLRSQGPCSFHPAPPLLKEKVQQAADFTASKGVDFAGLAARFALRNWKGVTVFGLSNVNEVEQAVCTYYQANDVKVAKSDEELVKQVRDILGETIDLTWPSGIEHPDMKE